MLTGSFAMATAAIRTGGMFNLMHSDSAIKVDMIVRKATPYRLVEFERRRRVAFGPGQVWIVSREDLILSKLDWSRASGSEMQHRDVHQLLEGPVDRGYLDTWAAQLGLAAPLRDSAP